MLTDLTVEQRALADYMSSLSELAFYAGWMENLEHALWRAIVDGPFRYGQLDITAEQTARLKALSSFCGGWIIFDGALEEAFIPLSDWQSTYDSACAL
jgi:hypothetical protein